MLRHVSGYMVGHVVGHVCGGVVSHVIVAQERIYWPPHALQTLVTLLGDMGSHMCLDMG